MPALRVIQFEPTPNPNAVKCLTDRPTGEAIRSYFNAGDAAGDALASRLFAIEGVTNVLIHLTFISVCKAPSADWKALRPLIRSAIEAEDVGGPGGSAS